VKCPFGDSSCAAPWANVKRRRGVMFGLKLSYLEGRQYLPVVVLRRAGTKDVI
jgi:hypothetical protein